MATAASSREGLRVDAAAKYSSRADASTVGDGVALSRRIDEIPPGSVLPFVNGVPDIVSAMVGSLGSAAADWPVVDESKADGWEMTLALDFTVSAIIAET